MLIGKVTHMWLPPEKTFSNAMPLTKLTGILASIFRFLFYYTTFLFYYTFNAYF